MTNRKIDINKSHKIDLFSLKTLFVSSFLGLILGLLGPFGSYAMPIVPRLIYWIVLFNLGYFIYYIAHKVTQNFLVDKQIKQNKQRLILFITPTLLAAIPLSYLVAFASQFLIEAETSLTLLALTVLPQVLVLGLAIDYVMHLIYPNSPQQKQHNVEKAGQAFINRIPTKLGTSLICLVMEDHYMIVYTEKGNHMLLMRMKDALIELKGFHGMQVHRSNWIAIDKVKSVNKTSRKTVLVMTNGIEISVSKKYLATIKEAGLS